MLGLLHGHVGRGNHRLVTGDEMFATMQAIGWSPATLARRLGVQESSVRQWLNGRREIPPNLADWLTKVRDAQGQAPSLPDGWRSGGG